MSLRSVILVVALASCGGGSSATRVAPGEPQTAREKQYADAEKAGEVDNGSMKWAKWRYTGNRDDCRFVIGRRCFKTEEAACHAASCGSKKCSVVGAGPATVGCEK